MPWQFSSTLIHLELYIIRYEINAFKYKKSTTLKCGMIWKKLEFEDSELLKVQCNHYKTILSAKSSS